MGRYVARRLLQLIPVIIGATFLIFAYLAGVETTQLWLAAQGERYDGALVSVD